jgi:hypothetical protein
MEGNRNVDFVFIEDLDDLPERCAKYFNTPIRVFNKYHRSESHATQNGAPGNCLNTLDKTVPTMVCTTDTIFSKAETVVETPETMFKTAETVVKVPETLVPAVETVVSTIKAMVFLFEATVCETRTLFSEAESIFRASETGFSIMEKSIGEVGFAFADQLLLMPIFH